MIGVFIVSNKIFSYHLYLKLILKKYFKYYIFNPKRLVSYSNSLFTKKLGCESVLQNQLGFYLAGLIEGDGSIIVPKTIRSKKNKLLYPVIKITFVNKDLPLANKIKEVLKGGTLSWSPNKTYVNLLIQDTRY